MGRKRNAPDEKPSKGECHSELASIESLLEQIRAEKSKIDSNEGVIIGCLLNMGRFLAELRTVSSRNWAKKLELIQIHQRVALRYIKLTESCIAEIGLHESDFLQCLPVDLMKLEWLCQLNRSQLKKLTHREDLKQASRPRVIALVKEVLGTASAETPAPNHEGKINKMLQRLLAVAKDAISNSDSQEDSSRIRDVLSEGAQQIKQLLEDRSQPQ